MLLFLIVLSGILFSSASYEPSWLPPAQKVARLTVSPDGLHYYLNFTLGTPPQVVRLVLDTGSANVVAFNRDTCDSNACYDPNESFTFELDRTSGDVFDLLVDGEFVGSSIQETGYEMLALSMEWIGTPAKENVSNSVGVLLASGLSVSGGAGPTPIHSNGWGSGIVGAAYQTLNGVFVSAFQALLSQASKGDPFHPIFSLDFKPANESSYIYIGGIAESYRKTLSWSAPHYSDWNGDLQAPPYHTFTVYDLSICGVNLITDSNNEEIVLNNGGLDGIIDTGASCLALPAEFFDMVASWLPIECGYDEDNKPFSLEQCQSTTGTTMYYLRTNTSESLPILSFRFVPGGPWLYLDLRTLILESQLADDNWPDPERKPFCLYRTLATHDNGQISFGTRVLRSFFVSLNMETYQVGIANKLMFHSSNVQCVERVICSGMQTHDPASNLCVNPQCQLYYFFTFDPETKTCQLAVSFHIIAIFVIFAFFFVELGLNELHQWLSTKVVKNIEETPQL